MPHKSEIGSPSDVPGLYVITIEGVLDPDWSDRVNGLQISHVSESSVPRTRLTGWLADQSALHGVLATLNGLMLPIVSLERVRVATDQVRT
jgi:hypothetical protein